MKRLSTSVAMVGSLGFLAPLSLAHATELTAESVNRAGTNGGFTDYVNGLFNAGAGTVGWKNPSSSGVWKNFTIFNATGLEDEINAASKIEYTAQLNFLGVDGNLPFELFFAGTSDSDGTGPTGGVPASFNGVTYGGINATIRAVRDEPGYDVGANAFNTGDAIGQLTDLEPVTFDITPLLTGLDLSSEKYLWFRAEPNSTQPDAGQAGVVRAQDQLLTITAVAGIVGDYDDSGAVEQGDLNLVLTNWGTDRSFSDPGGTEFSSLIVDQEELNVVLTNWGNASTPPSFEGVDVPEPASLIVMLAGTLGLSMRRRIA
ncbi:MAG: PEP-CTERM sorting domain-containing protein [Planctomycetota bacterium]